MSKTTPAKVFHYDLYGKRDNKYDFLNNNSIESIGWKVLENKDPYYFFVSKDFDVQETYNDGIKIPELFTLNNVGIVTARDSFTIHNTKNELQKTIEEFLSLDDETARNRFNLGKDVRDWQVNFAKKDLQINYPNKGGIVNICYRPFDIRWTFYTGKSKGFHCYPRTEVMQHFTKGKNVGLTLCKQFKTGDNYLHAFITNKIIESSYVSNRTSEITSVFPLYLYPETTGQQTIEQATERTPNLNIEIVNQIAEKLGLTFIPEKDTSSSVSTGSSFAPIDILDYIYAVLHSPTYRAKYKEFLKIDFPRVPYPDNKENFWQLVKLGGELRQLHLLESPKVNLFITTYPLDGNNEVEKIAYKDNQVWINETQYFAGVPQVAWEFYIGGYQPAQKWLKDRKGRVLSFEDILHYQKIIVALAETARVMQQINSVNFIS